MLFRSELHRTLRGRITRLGTLRGCLVGLHACLDVQPARLGSRKSYLGSRESQDRKSTRLNASHMSISYAVFCLKKKKTHHQQIHTPLTSSHPTHSSSPTSFTNDTPTTETYTLSLHDALPI